MKRNGWLHLLPDTISGRIIGLLCAGLILTTTGSLSIYTLDIFHGKGWDETFRNLQRIVVIFSIMDHASPDARLAWLPPLNETSFSVSWSPDETPPPLRQDSMTRHLARDIRVFSKIEGIDRIHTGYPVDAPSSSRWLMPETGPTEVWIELSDGTWLHFLIANEQIGGLWTLRLTLAASLLIMGIAGLGVWAARKATAPLAQFSLAAERLGANVDAPPLNDEEGPEEIRLAARAFNSMQHRIRRLIEDRTLMLAALSHDLRTALTRLRFRMEFISDPQQRQKAVGDRGPGIPESMRSRVFSPFYRLESSRSRDTGGTGLGLTVARTVIHCHGGDIRLEDRSGGGLLVRIVLPASAAGNTHYVES